MQPYEIRIELTDTIVQELLWRTLMPDSLAMTPRLNDALEQQYALIGPPPEGAQLAGVSVTMENDRVYAEITYAPSKA